MSGYKHATITISRDEYQRLHQAAMQDRFKQFTKSRSFESGRDEVMLGLLQEMEEREKYLRSALASMNQTSSTLDEEFFRTIQEQLSMNYGQMMQMLRNSNEEFHGSLNELAGTIVRQIEYEREENYQNMQAILNQQEAVIGMEYVKEDAAQSWLYHCTVMIDFIQSQFDHDRLTPGRMSKILRNFEMAENNYINGFTEACLQQAQHMYMELTDLNLELEQLILRWQTLFAETLSVVDEMSSQISANSNVPALGLQGEELPNFVNLDFWTNGRYQQLLENTRQLSTYMSQDTSLLTIEDIERIRAEILPGISQSFESIVFDARLNALNSQLRMNIAEKALEALENHGFVLDTSGYTNNDMRSQFNAQLECPDGSQVLIQVLPTEKSAEELSNELVVITTHPYLKSEHEARLHWEELRNTLTQYNLRVGRPEVLEAAANTDSVQNGIPQAAEHQYRRTER
jgi:hypothetical protein